MLDGVISYPYSTREIVAIVKHLEKYSGDGVVSAIENVVSFDSFNQSVRDVIAKVFQQNDIPLSFDKGNKPKKYSINIAEEKILPPKILVEKWKLKS